MTPEQLDHLHAIDAHLTALLDLAATRTPGEWLIHGMSVVNKTGFRIASTGYSDQNGHPRTNDAAFIAACAGSAEAGWRATKAAIAASRTPHPAMTSTEKKLLAAIYRGIRRGQIKTFVVQFTHKKKRKHLCRN